MKLLTELKSVAERIPVTFDVARLNSVCSELVNKLMEAKQVTWEEWTKAGSGRHSLNLSHLPGITGLDRYLKFASGYLQLTDAHAAGIWEHDFTEVPVEIKNSYIGQIFDQVNQYHKQKHGTEIRGRHQLVWVPPGACYSLHKDHHTTFRYHLPLITHPNVLWTFKIDDEYSLLHMPADGSIWEFDPIIADHTLANFSTITRLHLIMTSI